MDTAIILWITMESEICGIVGVTGSASVRVSASFDALCSRWSGCGILGRSSESSAVEIHPSRLVSPSRTFDQSPSVSVTTSSLPLSYRSSMPKVFPGPLRNATFRPFTKRVAAVGGSGGSTAVIEGMGAIVSTAVFSAVVLLSMTPWFDAGRRCGSMEGASDL
nr:hypothetical protein [Rhizobium laguerreae]